ncbi:MAG: NADPH-dependent reductase [Steroidobacteraceae bacterium]|nr:NADPH-dependent reductase [Steroidobacteraceae bacterium]
MSEPPDDRAGDVRKGQGDVKLDREEFSRRLRERFYDPAFEQAAHEVDRIVEIAWRNYDEYQITRRVARSPRGHPRRATTARRSRGPDAHPAGVRGRTP